MGVGFMVGATVGITLGTSDGVGVIVPRPIGVGVMVGAPLGSMVSSAEGVIGGDVGEAMPGSGVGVGVAGNVGVMAGAPMEVAAGVNVEAGMGIWNGLVAKPHATIGETKSTSRKQNAIREAHFIGKILSATRLTPEASIEIIRSIPHGCAPYFLP
jgi:hypothetical protein